MTDVRTDPLAFLGDELAELRAQAPVPAAAGHVVRPGAGRRRRRRRGDQPLVERLPRARPTTRGCARPRSSAVRDFGAGSGAVRTIAGTMELHEELERDLAAFKGTEAVLTFQSGFTANTGVIPTITGEQDLIVSDALNHASIIDGMRLSKAPRKIYPHGDVDGAARGAPRGARARPRRRRPPLPADPRRHRRRVQHGRRHRAAARHRRGGRGGRRRGLRRRRPRVGRARARTAAARSTTSGCTAGSRSRSGRCRRRSACSAATWRGRRTSATSSSSGPARSCSRRPHPPAVAAACREAIRVMQDEPELIERLWANTRRFKARAGEPRFRHRRLGDADHAGHDGRPGHRGPLQPAAVRPRRLRPAGRLPDGRDRQGAHPDDRHRRPRDDDRQLDRGRSSAHSRDALGRASSA